MAEPAVPVLPLRIPIAELKPGDNLKMFVYLVRRIEHKTTRQNKPYWKLQLVDSTGECACNVWDIPRDSGDVKADDFVAITGAAEEFNDKIQIKATGIYIVDEKSVDVADFMPCSKRDPAEMFSELHRAVEGQVFNNEDVRGLLLEVIDHPGIKPKLLVAPAASYYHQAYRGGLLEHILSLWGSANQLQLHYKELDRDILCAAAVLHDIGKCMELSADKTIQYTPIGMLVGHVIIGSHVVWNLMVKRRMPMDLQLRIQHVIAAHHGDFGDIKPVSREAVAFHYLDQLDAKLSAMARAFEEDKSGEAFVNVPILKRSAWRG